MAQETTKLGYGCAEDVQTAIDLGIVDKRDLIITRDTSEFLYIKDDLTPQTIRSRDRIFNSVSDANKQLNEYKDTFAGQTVMILDENGKYTPWIVQQSEATGLFLVEPFSVNPTTLQWTEF